MHNIFIPTAVLLQPWEFVFTTSTSKTRLLFHNFFQHHFLELARLNLHELEKKNAFGSVSFSIGIKNSCGLDIKEIIKDQQHSHGVQV